MEVSEVKLRLREGQGEGELAAGLPSPGLLCKPSMVYIIDREHGLQIFLKYAIDWES